MKTFGTFICLFVSISRHFTKVVNRIINEKQGSLNLFGLNPMVEKIISISQLDTVFNIHDIEENTLNKLL